MRSRWLYGIVSIVLALSPATAGHAAPAGDPPSTVIVQPGDTLWGLAHRNGTTVAELQRLNNLGTSTLIRVGQTLVLFEATRDRKVATAIAYATAQLGKWYRFGTAGPDTFDCSGLVMRAWEAAGVRLPRVTWQQINAGERVTRDRLVPGDLVFTNGGGHVELYIGDGKALDAGHTGIQVHEEDLPRAEQVVAYVHLTDV